MAGEWVPAGVGEALELASGTTGRARALEESPAGAGEASALGVVEHQGPLAAVAASSRVSRASGGRRVVALVLPSLAVDLARSLLRLSAHGSAAGRETPSRKVEGGVTAAAPTRRRASGRAIPAARALCRPFAVAEGSGNEARERLLAVSPEALPFGVREGQTVAEARTLLASLQVVVVKEAERRHALERAAEVASAFGATVALAAPDTVWVDVTGATHLFGGEAALVEELAARVRALGHAVRVASASGPLVARALARWSTAPRVIAEGEEPAALAPLPLAALPMETETVSWLARLGVLTLGGLVALPEAAIVTRLGASGGEAGRLLSLARGEDDTPLVPWQPPSTLLEELGWEGLLEGSEPLLFAARGLVARLSARLAARGQATGRLLLTVLLDPAIARSAGVEPSLREELELAAPLWRTEELGRVVSARLERLVLPAPAVGLRLEARKRVASTPRQLELARVLEGVTGQRGREALPALVAELTAELGRGAVGVLEVRASHRPEAESVLAPVRRGAARAPRARSARVSRGRGLGRLQHPLRLFTEPVPFPAPLRRGAWVALGAALYQLTELRFVRRLEAVEWWRSQEVSRDYVQVWLQGDQRGFEAWVYRDRVTGERWLQAVAD